MPNQDIKVRIIIQYFILISIFENFSRAQNDMYNHICFNRTEVNIEYSLNLAYNLCNLATLFMQPEIIYSP